MAVVGPPVSGKTTLLGEFTVELVQEMVYTGEWKATIVVSWDVLDVLRVIEDCRALLAFFVDLAVDTLTGQPRTSRAA